jgi:hypothetical protein
LLRCLQYGHLCLAATALKEAKQIGATRMTMNAAISVVPANEASWDDLRAIFGTRGDASKCMCQHFKILRRDWRSVPVWERAQRLRAPHRRCAPARHARPVDRA